MKKIRSVLIITFSLLVLSGVYAQEMHKGTYRFIDATNSARVAALGGTLVPIDDADIQLGIYNPSLINQDMSGKLALSYVDYFADINFATVQYARSFEKIGNFSASLQYHNYGSFDYADEGGLTGGTFNAADYAFVLGWGRQLDSNFSIGANAKFLATQYESYGSIAMAVDVAGTYQTNAGWVLSLTARNIGTELKSQFDGDEGSLPFSMQFGVSKRLEHVPFRFMLVYDQLQKWDLTYDDPLDLEGNIDPITGEKNEAGGASAFGDQLLRHLIVGGEFYIGKNLILRGSYNYRRRQEMKIPDKLGMVGFAWGVGIRISKFQINYSRSTYHVIGSPNYISIVTRLSDFTN
ncbi:MAG: type IX secretion system protein PorQ [Bacteroidetes bacterium]|nr:type IX secretion system protein PorQ [Bacteroidota bacterium]MBU1578558.1 type IX secretion system protein PorQ [Bacteroidota bacterium]MBU2557339.1 type IX secretion system protein PorQ [Bacteroidota bacterium]